MNVMLAFLGMGGGELLLVFVVFLLLFGSKKLPELARGLGQGMKEFKKATREVTDELNHAMDETPAPPAKRIAPISTVPAGDTDHAMPSSPPAHKV
jgi:sec-independent protein translocase protein TatA